MSYNFKEQRVELLKPKGQFVLQRTFDEHANVPDIKPDIDKILQTSAVLQITKEEISGEQLLIGGDFKVSVLYVPLNDKKPVHHMELKIPFEEALNVDHLSAKDYVKLDTVIEDFNVNLQNSRKLATKSLVQFKVDVSERKEAYIANDVETTEEIEKLVSKVSVCQLKDASKSQYRIKDELLIPSGKPNIMEILWHDITIQNKDIKLLDGKVNLKGNLHIATLYMAQDSDHHLEFIEHELGFNGLIDNPAAKETMLHDIMMNISTENIHIKLDADGEERVLAIEVDTKVDMKIYSDQEISVLRDVYSLGKDLSVVTEAVNYQKLLCKNQSQTNIKETILIDQEDLEILQMYYTSGNAIIDTLNVQNDKIKVEGTVLCKVMYVAADDRMPIHVSESYVPFEHSIEVKGIQQSSKINVSPVINYIGCTMIGEKEVELKCSVLLNTFVFEDYAMDNIKAIDEKPTDYKVLQKLPGIVGYVTNDKDNLWDIAKKYKTKVKSIMKTNGLEDEKLSKGCHLIIVKELHL